MQVFPQTPATTIFGDTDAFLPNFRKLCQLRQVRNPMHVLIVEDDPLTRRMLTNLLSDQHATINAADGQDAVLKYLSFAPDMVFLDLGLPLVSGLDVLDRIMQFDPEAYVVIISANTHGDTLAEATSRGAKGFIGKPFALDKLDHFLLDCAGMRGKHLD
jgi:DNA-binding NtrC family response regulator